MFILGLVVLLALPQNVEWYGVHGGDGIDSGIDVVEIADGFVIVCRKSIGEYYRTHMLRINHNGDSIWAQMYDFGAYDEFPSRLLQTPIGYFIGGHIVLDPPAYNSDIYFLRTDLLGQDISSKVYGKSNFQDILLDIEPIEDEMKVDLDGNVVWYKEHSEWYTVRVISGFQLRDKGYIVSSTCKSYKAYNAEYDFYFATFDSLGNYIWSHNYGTPEVNITGGHVIQMSDNDYSLSEMCKTIIKTSDGGFLTTGMSVNPAYQSDILNVKYTSELGIMEYNQDVTSLGLKVFPNPVADDCRIEYQLLRSSHVTLKIYDTSGRLMDELVNQVQGEGIYSIYWHNSDLPAGIYFFSHKTDKDESLKKVLLLK
jgi:hypothetical protein